MIRNREQVVSGKLERKEWWMEKADNRKREQMTRLKETKFSNKTENHDSMQAAVCIFAPACTFLIKYACLLAHLCCLREGLEGSPMTHGLKLSRLCTPATVTQPSLCDS